MTYAPTDLFTVHTYLRLRTGLDPNSLGVVGDTSHQSQGGYHVGNDTLSNIGKLSTDYSKRESSRDRPGTNAASAIDIGNFSGRVPLTRFILDALNRGDPRVADIREVIYSLDGKTVHRWDRLGIRPSGDSSHTTHTHISFFRDSEGRRSGDNNFLGLVREYFEGKIEVMDERLLNGWNPGKELNGNNNSRGAGVMAGEVWTYLMDGRGFYGTSANDPSGAASPMYLDRLLKLIRDKVDVLSAKVDAVSAPQVSDTQAEMMARVVAAAVVEALKPLFNALGSAGDAVGKLND